MADKNFYFVADFGQRCHIYVPIPSILSGDIRRKINALSLWDGWSKSLGTLKEALGWEFNSPEAANKAEQLLAEAGVDKVSYEEGCERLGLAA